MKIIQDLKIIQNLISRFPETGNQLNIIMIGNAGGYTDKEPEPAAGILQFDFASYLEGLPQPRLKNLIKNAIAIAIAKYPNNTEAGKWLGGSRRIINYRINQMFPEE